MIMSDLFEIRAFNDEENFVHNLVIEVLGEF